MYNYNLGIAFERVAEQYPGNIALKFADTDSVTYEQLNQYVNRCARYLLNVGVHQRDVIAIGGDKKLATFVAILASLKIGVVYTVFDPDSPLERLRKILSRAAPELILADAGLIRGIAGVSGIPRERLIDFDVMFGDLVAEKYDSANLSETRRLSGENPAYIMFTSGSTGFPKGAVITHSNVLNLINWSRETYNTCPDDVFTNLNPLYFDNSVFDLYASLFSGAALVPFFKEVVADPKLLIDTVDKLQCTSWFSVPSLLIFLDTMRVFRKDNFNSINRFIFGGEGYPKAKLKNLYDVYADRAELHNVYGPTECTCICSSYRISSDDFSDLTGFPPLGRIADNFSYVILDANNEYVENGSTGELCLLGPNVGKGYYNDTERTAANFVKSPFITGYDEIMYRTGDMVRYQASDDKIYIVGRVDNQIKHMGYRIELEEIETALCQIPSVAQAAVVHGESRGLSQIVAILLTINEINEHIVRDELSKIIPNYMIPNQIYFDSELPKNANGKVDRQTLKARYL